MRYWLSYLFIALTVLFTVYGQVAIKWAVMNAGDTPADSAGKIGYLFHLLGNGWVLSGLAAAFLASLCWMLAIGKLPLSHAYPFVGSSFILVLLLSSVVFGEPVGWHKVAGVVLIFAGITISSQG